MPIAHYSRRMRDDLLREGRTECNCHSGPNGVGNARSRIYAAARRAGVTVRTKVVKHPSGKHRSGWKSVVAVVKPDNSLFTDGAGI